MVVCPYCEPNLVDKRHLKDRLFLWLEKIFKIFLWPLLILVRPFGKIYGFISLFTQTSLVSLAYLLKIITLKIPIGEKKIPLRTRLFALACLKRKLICQTFYFFNYPTPLCRLKNGRKSMLFDTLPTSMKTFINGFKYDDKFELKKMLANHQFPVARGAKFYQKRKALRYAFELASYGKIVVKPADGSLSRHTFVGIRSRKSVVEAVEQVFKISNQCLVEQYVRGHCFRVTCVGFQLVAAARRDPANVIGDGRNNISQLIAIKNSDPKRGPTDSKDYALHHIPINDFLIERLAWQSLTLAYVPEKGEKIILNSKVNLASGADIIDVTATVHPHNRVLFERVATLLGEPIIGLDIITDSLGSSYKNTNDFSVIEANPLPFFEMHHFPSEGEMRDVAGKLADLYVK